MGDVEWVPEVSVYQKLIVNLKPITIKYLPRPWCNLQMELKGGNTSITSSRNLKLLLT